MIEKIYQFFVFSLFLSATESLFPALLTLFGEKEAETGQVDLLLTRFHVSIPCSPSIECKPRSDSVFQVESRFGSGSSSSPSMMISDSMRRTSTLLFSARLPRSRLGPGSNNGQASGQK